MYSRDIVWGRDGNTGWKDVFDGKHLSDFKTTGEWKEDYGALIGASTEGAAHFFFGDNDWKSYELSVAVTVIKAGNAQILFRVDNEAQGHYLVDFLLGWQALAVSRVDERSRGKGLKKLSVVNCPLREGEEYRLEIAVRDFSITTYIDGTLINQVADETYHKGAVALTAYQGTVRYKDIKYRILA